MSNSSPISTTVAPWTLPVQSDSPWPTSYPCSYPVYCSAPAIQRFRGRVPEMSNLPKGGYQRGQASVGDAWFIEDPGVLVVRAVNGWHQFDTE